MHNPTTIDDVVDYAKHVKQGVKDTGQPTTTIFVRPLKKGFTEKHDRRTQRLKGVRLRGSEGVYLLITDHDTPTLAVKWEFSKREMTLEEYLRLKLVDIRAIDKNGEVVLDNKSLYLGRLDDFTKRLSELLPENHYIRQQFDYRRP